MLVVTSPGTFVWLEAAFEHDFRQRRALPTWISRGSYTHTFNKPGFYNVTCDIHTTMRATMYVTSTPYVGTADERGRFTFDNVVPGTYKVAGFADGQPIEKTVEVAGRSTEVTLR